MTFSARADEISCEHIELVEKSELNRCYLKTTALECYLIKIVPEDESVNELYMNSNKKAEQLPVNLYKTFKNLESIDARNCAIKSISAENFKNLSKLKALLLSNNHISSIDSDTFEDLKSVEKIWLSKYS